MSAYSPIHRFASAFFALAIAFACVAIAPQQATASSGLAAGDVRIHVMSFNNIDAIIVECDGHFGVVDSGESSDSPDGSDPRYPVRAGTTIGQGVEDEVKAYMTSIGVTQDNLDFYIGTHPHSDHVGNAPEIIEAFHPKAIYLPYYDDSLITDSDHLWDNQYVYDRFVDAAVAAQNSYGARFIQHLTTNDSTAERTGSPVLSLGSAQVEIFNYDETYRQTKVPDANCFSYGVKVTASNGRSAFLAGDICNYIAGDGNGVGDEDRLKTLLGTVDFYKIAHHGYRGSNSPDYLRTILKQANAEDRCVVVQTGSFEMLSRDTLEAMCDRGVRYFNASEMRRISRNAFVADLTANGVKTNVEDTDSVVVRDLDSSPFAVLTLNGVFCKGSGWYANAKGKEFYFGDEASGNQSAFAYVDCLATRDGARVYIDKNGDVVSYSNNEDGNVAAPVSGNKKLVGWQKVGTNWVHYNASGELSKGWLKDKGKWYYLNESGCMVTGWKQVDGKWYYLDSSGVVKTGWVRSEGHWFFFDASGAMHTGWMRNNGAWYYLNDAGVMVTGWQQVGDDWYFMNSSGVMYTGWTEWAGKWYYLTKSGALAKGWVSSRGAWYFMNSSGVMVTGWLDDGGARYFLSTANGAMRTGWVKSDGVWYYMGRSGAMSTGWIRSGNSWYYMNPADGKMRTGWLSDTGKSYYLKDSGAMAKGWQSIQGKWYNFDRTGAMQKDKWVGKYYLGSDGVMVTNRWIGIYHVNDKGKWDATDKNRK